jgi:hypothetical protein
MGGRMNVKVKRTWIKPGQEGKKEIVELSENDIIVKALVTQGAHNLVLNFENREQLFYELVPPLTLQEKYDKLLVAAKRYVVSSLSMYELDKVIEELELE